MGQRRNSSRKVTVEMLLASQERPERWMFGEIRKTHERRPTPIVKIAASIRAAGSRRGFRRLCGASGLEVVVDLKRRERLARHGAVAGRLADGWGAAVRSAAFHFLVRRP